MKMISQKEYEEIRVWMHRNARPLELSVWNYYFENGQKEEIINALAFYQNEDGGFGNCVEPDCWNKESSPYATMTVIGLLREISFIEEAGIGHPLVDGIFRYLENTEHGDENGWYFVIPSNDRYPRAPWMTYDQKTNQEQAMGVTAVLCAFILRYGRRDSELYERAIGYARNILNQLNGAADFGEMGAGGVSLLLVDILTSGLAGIFKPLDLEQLLAGMAVTANRSMERNPDKWAEYTPRPSDFIPSPDSPLYSGNEEIVAAELDYLADTRNPGGVWDITWSWYALGDQYPKEFAISENWWMANKAIGKLNFLKNFGRIAAR